ncbi:hypothetical protein DVH24_037960 [Malus domestica]|uniref:Trichome birefringence-like C-terminal domain-containing protein n=1 Tax=Malus domestica TaxID=3750 RepID=A0A498K517_MALDO|nr:hypothetical protein DVH24_037960 [Malus domestica]
MVRYLRAVLLTKYEWQPKQDTRGDQDGLKGTYRVDVDIPTNDWANISDFYDVLSSHLFIVRANQYYRPLICQINLKLFLRIWYHTYKRMPFRADAHPAIWLGQKDVVLVWGQDCMHWCLPGVPDTWVDILSKLIHVGLEIRW